MPANKRRVAATAPYDRWVLLGKLLEGRRRELGHTWRTTFEESGVNGRMQADFEKAAKDRVNHFMPGTFQLIAKGYRVTEESMMAVLRGEADHLVPAAAIPPPDGDAPPFTPERAAADRPWFDPINERRVELASRGIAYPTGAQMFGEGTEDAKAWDEEGAPLRVGDRVWFIADLRRRAAGRNDNSGTGTTGG